MSNLFELKNCPIFAAGTWNNDTYSEADLDAMVLAHSQVGFRPPLKLGHDESQPLAKSDSMPAMGWVANLRRVGKTLYADFTSLPKQIWDAITRKAYNRVSAEVYWDYAENGRKFPRVLKAVALLGADIPAVTSLQALESLYASQGQTVKTYMDSTMPMPMMAGGGAVAIASPGKAKADVNYQEASDGGYERCGACKFFTGPADPEGANIYVGACAIVEGEIASSFVCDLVEVRDAFTEATSMEEFKKYGLSIQQMDNEHCVMKDGKKVKCFPDKTRAQEHMSTMKEEEAMARAVAAKTYIIRKRGDKWCLLTHDGTKTLGCHDTEEGAMAQERAVQASKHATEHDHEVKEYRYSVEEVEKFCPDCAKNMRFLNISELKISYDPVTKTYAGFSEGLCKRFAPGAGFRTRCMESSMGDSADNPGALCNALEDWCSKSGHLASKTSQTQEPKTLGDARSTEDVPMTDDEKKQLETLQQQVAELTKTGEAQTKALTDAQAQLKTYEQQIAASESEKAAAAEASRQTENTAWLDKMCEASALRMLPVERPYVAYLLDILSGSAGTKLKTYAKDGKDGAKEELPAVAVFKRLFEQREPNKLLFRELTTGSVTQDASKPPLPEGLSMAAARQIATDRAKEYILAEKKAGRKVEFKEAYAHILSEDSELRLAAGGVRPEGVRKAADNAAAFKMVSGQDAKGSDGSA